ncbi:hypothetical protein RMSM_04291 [Rhodopirellula maiorica SM1]|uniref:Uncharacterized protein n=1 Tax=Rhodopirellula maiorica SM1 TaxID=1265738 RepID=M5RHV2_9BACT|nr:hypothetical protein RMSM_04291 [Rhodopirellula maiorica SM1]
MRGGDEERIVTEAESAVNKTRAGLPAGVPRFLAATRLVCSSPVRRGVFIFGRGHRRSPVSPFRCRG